MNTLYTAVATASSGREGRVRTEDGKIDLDLSIPEGMGGSGGPGTNPEQLFAAGYSACFGSAVRAVAARQKVNPRESTITAKVSIVQTEEGEFRLAVELVGAFPELTQEQGAALMRAAHEICPYSNATRGNVEVTLSVA